MLSARAVRRADALPSGREARLALAVQICCDSWSSALLCFHCLVLSCPLYVQPSTVRVHTAVLMAAAARLQCSAVQSGAEQCSVTSNAHALCTQTRRRAEAARSLASRASRTLQRGVPFSCVARFRCFCTFLPLLLLFGALRIRTLAAYCKYSICDEMITSARMLQYLNTHCIRFDSIKPNAIFALNRIKRTFLLCFTLR